jgi:hypothetical protein
MFEKQFYEHPRDETRRVMVGASGYVAAALAGSVYVLWKAGNAGFVASFVAHALIMVALLATTGVTSLFLPSAQQMIILIVAFPVLLVFQSIYMIGVINQTYRNRGWIVHSA